MMMPSCPTPYFIRTHPQQLLAVFKTRFDGPPHPAHPHVRFQRDVDGGIAQGGLQLSRLDVSTPRQAAPPPPPAPSAPLGPPPPGTPAAGGVHAHAMAGREWPGARPRPASCAALRRNTTGPPPPPHPESLGCPQTPRPPPPNDTAGSESARSRRASPGPTRAWF